MFQFIISYDQNCYKECLQGMWNRTVLMLTYKKGECFFFTCLCLCLQSVFVSMNISLEKKSKHCNYFKTLTKVLVLDEKLALVAFFSFLNMHHFSPPL